jgi:hypothetical protein
MRLAACSYHRQTERPTDDDDDDDDDDNNSLGTHLLSQPSRTDFAMAARVAQQRRAGPGTYVPR